MIGIIIFFLGGVFFLVIILAMVEIVSHLTLDYAFDFVHAFG